MITMKTSFSTTEIAQLLNITPEAVRHLIHNGQLRATKGASSRYVISLEDLAAFGSSALAHEVTNEATTTVVPRAVTRRRFLGEGVLGLVAVGVISDIVGSGVVTLVFDAFARAIREHEAEAAQDQRAKRAVHRMFGGLTGFGWSAGLGHMVDSYGLHAFSQSSTMRAASALGAALELNGDSWLEHAIYTEAPPAGLLANGNLIATGSPVNDIVARLALGYVGENRYGLRRSPYGLLELPFEYVNDHARLPAGAPLARRFVAGQPREMPNWTLSVDGQILAPPRLRADRGLASDYLLVSRVPNVLTSDGFLGGREVLIIGGSHGPGTEAVRLLLQDAPLMERLASEIGSRRFYQVLIPVVDVQDEAMAGEMRTLPVELGEPTVRSVGVDRERVLASFVSSEL